MGDPVGTGHRGRGGSPGARADLAPPRPRWRPDTNVTARPGSSARVRANLAVLHVLRTLEGEHRPARGDELPLLAGWSGWGAVPQLFDPARPEHALHHDELAELMSADELRAADQPSHRISPPPGRDPAAVAHIPVAQRTIMGRVRQASARATTQPLTTSTKGRFVTGWDGLLPTSETPDPDVGTRDGLLELLDAQAADLVSVSTGGPKIEQVNAYSAAQATVLIVRTLGQLVDTGKT